MDLIVEGAMIGFGAGIACVAGLWHAFVLREYLPGGRKGFIEVVTSSFCCFWITASHAIVGFGVGAIYFNVVSNPNFLGAVVGLFVGGLLGCMIWLLTWLASKLAVRIQ
jgi:hypothetical protein